MSKKEKTEIRPEDVGVLEISGGTDVQVLEKKLPAEKRPEPRHVFMVGPRGAGKTTLGLQLAAALARPCVETSERLNELLARIYAAEHGGKRSMAECLALIRGHKEMHRPALRELGNIVTSLNGGYLINKALHEGGNQPCVVNGVRRVVEVSGFYLHPLYQDADETMRALTLEAAMRNDLWVFVEKPGTGLEQDSFDRGFFERFCKIHVTNDGGEDCLRAAVKQILKVIRGEAGGETSDAPQGT